MNDVIVRKWIMNDGNNSAKNNLFIVSNWEMQKLFAKPKFVKKTRMLLWQHRIDINIQYDVIVNYIMDILQ